MKKLLTLLVPVFISGCGSDIKMVRAPHEPVYPTHYAPLNQVRHNTGTVAYDTGAGRKFWRNDVWRNKEAAYRAMSQQCGGQYYITRHDYSAHPWTDPMEGGKFTNGYNVGGPRNQTFYIDFRCANQNVPAHRHPQPFWW